MFERYTDAARRSIFFARYEASQFGSKFIECHHLLLGLLHESSDVFRPLFQSPDAPEAIRNEYKTRLPRQPPVPTSVDIPLSHKAKRALAWGAEEAERLGHKHIGVEHLMLGLLRDEQSDVANDLRRYGMSLEGMRSAAAASAARRIPLLPASLVREQLHRLADALDETRVPAAAQILEALGKDIVTITIAAPGANYVFTFDSPAKTGEDETPRD